MQPLFQQGTGPILRLLLLCALSISLMVWDHQAHHLATVRGFLSGAIAPLRYAVNAPAELVGWGSERMQDRATLLQRVAALERENLRLRARQQKFETIQSENERLRALLESSAKRDERVLVAELLSVDLDPYRQQVVINQGANDGVYRGQPLIDAYGVMGQIIHVGPITATALLISDPNHALPVQINRNGLRTIASGTGEPDRLQLLYIPNSADVRVGDLVVTSGLGGRFPSNYPVARVVKVERRPGRPFAEVVAEPRAQLDRSREVLLVWPGGERPREGEGDPARTGSGGGR
ncbi:MAG: rod shape-determining protein MreC [Halofilum sp. (in: g-proteobacteria)]|nr:rod shape-determining protein MreC [Halofilum sp. (in: g-proteobacteria)]